MSDFVIDSSLRTVEWKNNKVIMIEQTKLPNELIFVKYDHTHMLLLPFLANYHRYYVFLIHQIFLI